jgi:hypothetical protein
VRIQTALLNIEGRHFHHSDLTNFFDYFRAHNMPYRITHVQLCSTFDYTYENTNNFQPQASYQSELAAQITRGCWLRFLPWAHKKHYPSVMSVRFTAWHTPRCTHRLHTVACRVSVVS